MLYASGKSGLKPAVAAFAWGREALDPTLRQMLNQLPLPT